MTTSTILQTLNTFSGLVREKQASPSALAMGFLRLKLVAFYEGATSLPEGRNIFEKLLRHLDVHIDVPDQEVARIPESGPVVIVANHPFGLLEGALLGSVCSRVRPDVKIMANSLLSGCGDLESKLILVDPYQSRDSVDHNRAPMRQALKWLRSGGLLIVFPSGDVSRPDLSRGSILDPPWNPSIARLIQVGRAKVVPAFLSGRNSAAFHLIGALHPKLRTVQLPTEFLNKRGRTIRLTLGRPVDVNQAAPHSPDDLITRLRARTYMLGEGLRDCRRKRRSFVSIRRMAPIADPVPGRQLEQEVGALPADRVLASSSGRMQVLWITENIAPGLLREVCRLREGTFRGAGEGTGMSLDRDEFDAYYDHLVLWDAAEGKVAGGYRLGRTSGILAARGIAGLYTSKLFRFDPEFFAAIGPAIELGRSFVAPEYQKQYAPLLLLWKGIGGYVCRHPECRYLFGPVSMSAEYLRVSRELVARALAKCSSEDGLSRMVHARAPLRPYRAKALSSPFDALFQGDVEEISAMISDLEPDGKGLPVLLRQYLKLGGKFLGFSVDRKFSNVLDGLVMVDLLRTDRSALQRYFTPEGTARFLSHHSIL